MSTERVAIASSGFIHAPGILHWMRRVYRDGQHDVAVRAFAVAVPEVPIGMAVAFLEGKLELTEEPGGEHGPTAVFEIDLARVGEILEEKEGATR